MIDFYLHDGTMVSSEMKNYNAAELLEKITDPKIVVVAVGNSIINKNMIKLISPQYPSDKVWSNYIKVSLHDGLVGLTEDTSFNSVQFAEILNDPTLTMISIGELIIAKNYVRMIQRIDSE